MKKAPFRLQLFGTPAVEYGGQSIPLTFERCSQLLALFALKATWVGRTELATILWPDQSARLAFANLRKTLFRSRPRTVDRDAAR
ncbi:MAG: hypothetical protein ABI831_02955 [Betaproteobacteria bacterium]